MSCKCVMASVTTSGHAVNTSSVKWSEDNSVAVIVDKYVYLLDSRCDPHEWTQHFPYHKSVLNNQKQSPAFDTGLDPRRVMAGATPDEQQILMMDPSLTAQAANATTFRSYRRVEWSPLRRKLGCLLGALTIDHRLVVYRKDVEEWEVAIDLSLLLNNKLKEKWTDISRPNYNLFRERMHSLATNAFCWAQSWVEAPTASDKVCANCMLFMASKNGLITFWDITVSPQRQISAQFLYKWSTTYGQINCLKSFDDFLLISSSRGQVYVIYTGISSDSEPNPLSIWSESDNICVNEFAIKTKGKNYFEIVFTKSDFVIICRMSADINGEDVSMSLKYCKTEVGLHRMPSSAICPIVGSKYLLTSLDGRLVEIDVFEDDSPIIQTEVTLDSVSSTAMCGYGVDSSPNGVLSALVHTLSPYHDHLVIKEPVQVVVFLNISFETLTNIFYEKFLSEKSITKNSRFDECFDLFDCVRSFLSSAQYSNCETFLFTLIDNQKLIKECNDLLKLRVIRFITRVYITHCKAKASPLRHRLEANALLCEDMILKQYIHDLYTGVVCDLETLTETQLLSLKNMNQWLFGRFSEKLFADDCFDFSAIDDVCPICGQVIAFTDRSVGSCSQSHRFNRCHNSLVLCDFVNYKYEKCLRCCQSFVIKPSVWNQSSICLYCG